MTWLRSTMSGLITHPVVREAECVCSRCGEGLFFVPGERGAERWRHVRTDQVRCHPRCAECGLPATEQVGNDAPSGDGSIGFRRSRWLCTRHAGGRLCIDRV